MSDAERFDAFYADHRERLLVLAFVLTGDLPAARTTVRDSFIAAWHHWSRLERLAEPGQWVWSHVRSHARRRPARIWNRDRGLDPDLRATVDALSKLSPGARETLLLARLPTSSAQDVARQVGLSPDEAELRLQAATAQLAGERQVASREVPSLLDRLVEHCADQRWPRATIIRRAGTNRRRTHALLGAALLVGTLVGAGFLVTDQHGVRPTLASAGDRLTSVPSEVAGDGSGGPDSDLVTPALLLGRTELARAVPHRAWRITGTDPRHGATLPCQRTAYADPRASTALVRNLIAGGAEHERRLAAVQTMEVSADPASAHRGFVTARSWFAACSQPRTQLVSVRRVRGLGDEAEQYTLRVWGRPASTLVVGVARTGRITMLMLTRTSRSAPQDSGTDLRLLAAAVDDVCHTSLGGRCSPLPEARVVPVPRAGRPPMMLSEFDLPPASGLRAAWVGTTPQPAVRNVAATGCDRSSFHGDAWRHAVTRSFLVPGGDVAPAFGITETVGRLPLDRAKAFADGVRSKLASCPDRELGTKVLRLASGPSLAAWRVRTQVSDSRSVTFLMGIVRSGGAVAQVGFVPDARHTVSTADFVAMVRRAGQRLTAMPS